MRFLLRFWTIRGMRRDASLNDQSKSLLAFGQPRSLGKPATNADVRQAHAAILIQQQKSCAAQGQAHQVLCPVLSPILGAVMTSLPLSIKRATLLHEESKALRRSMVLIDAHQFKLANEFKEAADSFRNARLALENERAA